MTPFTIHRTFLNRYGNSVGERLLAIIGGIIISTLSAFLLILLPCLVYLAALVIFHFIHLPFPIIKISVFMGYGIVFVISILIFDTFITPWLSQKALGLKILRLYPASRWAIRFSVLLLLTQAKQHNISFPKCVFWEIHTSYKTRKPSKKLTFTRLLLRDIRIIDSYFNKFTCFYGHTPMPVDKLIVISKPESLVNIQGPFLSKTPANRALIAGDKPTPWHVYLISINDPDFK